MSTKSHVLSEGCEKQFYRRGSTILVIVGVIASILACPTVIIWHAGHKAIEYNATIYNDNASREELHQRIHTQKQVAGHAAIVLLSIQVFCYFLLTMFAIYERQR